MEQVDAWLTGLLTGAPLLTALGVACLLGLRHASDPDHLVAVTSVVAAEQGGHGAMRLGAWWGVGHAGTLLAVGMPLVLLESGCRPGSSEGAERAIGLVMVLLAARVLVRWLRGEFRGRMAAPGGAHGDRPRLRSRRQALGIGVLHGVAGTGAVVVLLIAQLPSPADAGLALLVFAPMSMFSMVVCTRESAASCRAARARAGRRSKRHRVARLDSACCVRARARLITPPAVTTAQHDSSRKNPQSPP